MSRPTQFGRKGQSFDSETSAFTTPPVSPTRPTQQMNSQVVPYHHPGAVYGGYRAHGDAAPRPTYYVQSPSRDSFTFTEADTFSQSLSKLTPPGSPGLASPLHQSFSSKPHQHQHQHQQQHHQLQQNPQHHHHRQQQYQQQQVVYGNPRPGSRRVLPQPNNVAAGGASPVVAAAHKKGYQPWNGGGTIREEEENQDYSGRRGISRWCALFLSIMFTLVCIVMVGVIYWLVCRPSAPRIEVKNITFETFSVDEGNDFTGVPTSVLTTDVTTSLSYVNPSKYFGFHVSAPDVTLVYQQISVADGKGQKFFQKKKSQGTIVVNASAARQPVYGAGPNLLSAFSSGEGLPLQLRIRIQSKARVIWKIVQPKYESKIVCDLVLDTNSQQGKLKIASQDCHRG